MTHGTTLAALGRALAERLGDGLSSRLVTLLGASGPAYARPGAMLLLTAAGERDPGDASLAGYLSAGCLEEEVAARSMDVSPTQPVARLSLDTGDDGPFGLGLACGGVLDLLVEVVGVGVEDRAAWRSWADALAAGRPARRWIEPGGTVALQVPEGAVHALRDGSALVGSDGTWTASQRAWDLRAPDVHAHLARRSGGWLHEVPARPTLRIVGSELEAGVVAETMLTHGWGVEVVAPSRVRLGALREGALLRTGRDLRTVVADEHGVAGMTGTRDDRILAASHRLDLDVAAGQAARGMGVRWFGAIGSAKRAAALRSAWAASDHGDAPHLTTEIPAGLDVGARGPHEIATAITGRLVADLRDAARPVWAVLPAAGGARRMGFPKALLHDGSETLLARAQRLAWQVADGVVLVTGAEREQVERERLDGVKTVHVEDWQAGMRASLVAGIGATPRDARVLVILPDMPGVDEEHLANLAREGRRAAGAVSVYPDGRVGAPAVLPMDVVTWVRSEPDGHGVDAGFGSWLQDRSDLARVPLDDARDVDDPAAARAAGWLPGPVAP